MPDTASCVWHRLCARHRKSCVWHRLLYQTQALCLTQGYVLPQPAYLRQAGKPKFFEFWLFHFFCGGFCKIAKARPLRGRWWIRIANSPRIEHWVLFLGFCLVFKNSVHNRRAKILARWEDRVRGFGIGFFIRHSWLCRHISCVWHRLCTRHGALCQIQTSVKAQGCFGIGDSVLGTTVSGTGPTTDALQASAVGWF